MWHSKQFRDLLSSLKNLLPLPKSHLRMGIPFECNHRVYLQSQLSHRACALVFRKWHAVEESGLQGMAPDEKTQVWLDVAKRLRKDFDPELLLRLQQQKLEYAFSGGILNEDLWVHFSINMESEESCRAHLRRFETIVPVLAEALMRACPRPLLTDRERAILERRAMGELIKQIASAQGISERTVRMHLQRIKKKLYTDDLVNAVVIAVRSGMLAPLWKEWRWRSRRRR